MLNVKNWSTDWGGRKLTIEVGKLALQSHGSCTVRYGDTLILATVVRSKNVRPDIDYFPLLVDFEEKLYAAGKIKGSRFIKREGRPSDEAILSGRMIDRSIRPLFDERLRNDVQVVLTCLSVDGENDAAITALVAASCALTISPVPWNGPIAGARIGRNKEGQFILNVKTSELEEESDLDLVVAGTPNRVIMVEAGAKEVPEDVMNEAMKWGCAQFEPVLDLIAQIQKEVGQPKDKPPEDETEAASSEYQRARQAKDFTRQFVLDSADSMIFESPKIAKAERLAMIERIEGDAAAALQEKGFTPEEQKAGLQNIKDYVAEAASKRILERDQRLDGRSIEDVRELNMEVDVVPRVHGSAMFMRGDTQVLSTVTLGAPGDVQTLDSMEGEGTKRYMHHYNDAPFTYGEAGFMRGPGRRAIGHGALAEKALDPVLPSEDDFPQAIRVVSEVLGANGSSSMASVCGSTLSLMSAGVPIGKPVAGLAMGLASDDSGRWRVLTDLQDVEDGKGGMDFKIAGTREGITAIQMDTKTTGLSWEIVDQTLRQARDARMRILDAMTSVIERPREDLSEFAPRIRTLKIDPEKIGDLIGPSGKHIRKITEQTGVTIDVEQDGRVRITSVDAEAMDEAVRMVDALTHKVQVGEIYDGTVVRLENFGAFVELLPNQDGMVHVSHIAWERVEEPRDVLSLGDKVKVKVREVDHLGRVNLTMKELVPKPEGYVEEEPRPRSGPPRSRDDRGGGRDGRSDRRPPRRDSDRGRRDNNRPPRRDSNRDR